MADKATALNSTGVPMINKKKFGYVEAVELMRKYMPYKKPTIREKIKSLFDNAFPGWEREDR